MAFPPVPVYPNAIDSDYTLFLVYNTTETRISSDSSPWSQEIDVVPVASDKPDIWANNGFANIDGELLYYDAVERLGNKVIKLKKCSRQLGGDPTKFNKKGTWIRSYVVAEHHNQLIDAVLKVEDFVGYNFDPRKETLDWRIRNLRAVPIIFDDFDCPDVDFTFNIIESNPVTGILARYIVSVTPPGTINSFRLDFGDGNYTTTSLDGTHRYAVNARIDPVITVANDKCQIVQTPIERENPAEPPAEVERVFEIPVPESVDIPDFTYVACDVPEPDVVLPPLVFPCISIEGQIGPIPSIIQGPSINMVSNVVIHGPDEPVQILHSVITIIGGPINIPPIIIIDPPIPPTIIIDPPIPPTIIIIPPESEIRLMLDADELPRLEVDWGMPPDMEVALTLAQRVASPQRFAADPEIVKEFGQEFADLFEASTTMKVEYESVGIPEEIRILPPEFPAIQVEHTIPNTIKVDYTEASIPTSIKIYGPDSPIPNIIKFDSSDVPESVDLVYRGDPIPLQVIGLPMSIKVEMDKTIPDRIIVEIPTPIPEKIIVEGMPDRVILDAPASIKLEIPENFGIPLIMPEKMPEMELVYRGSPIEFKISMDQVINKEADGRNCVMIVPCQS